MNDENGVKAMGQVIQIDEARIRDHLGEMVRDLRTKRVRFLWVLLPLCNTHSLSS
jgi:hypothetical protein